MTLYMIFYFPTSFYAFRTIITDQVDQVDYAIKKTQVD